MLELRSGSSSQVSPQLMNVRFGQLARLNVSVKNRILLLGFFEPIVNLRSDILFVKMPEEREQLKLVSISIV